MYTSPKNNILIDFKMFSKGNVNKHMYSLLEIEKHMSFDSWNENNFRMDLCLKEMLSFILFVGQEVVGFAVMSQKTRDCIHLHRFCLAKEWQGKGIGKIMMKEGISKTRKIQASYLSLKVSVSNTQAINFYNNYGFKDLFVQNGYLFKILQLI